MSHPSACYEKKRKKKQVPSPPCRPAPTLFSLIGFFFTTREFIVVVTDCCCCRPYHLAISSCNNNKIKSTNHRLSGGGRAKTTTQIIGKKKTKKSFPCELEYTRNGRCRLNCYRMAASLLDFDWQIDASPAASWRRRLPVVTRRIPATLRSPPPPSIEPGRGAKNSSAIDQNKLRNDDGDVQSGGPTKKRRPANRIRNRSDRCDRRLAGSEKKPPKNVAVGGKTR